MNKLMNKLIDGDAGKCGNWLLSFTGRQLDPLNPDVDQIVIEDIAHALSNCCRFAGHTREFYSVAQHAVLVSYICKDPWQGLHHDDPEYVIGDMTRVLKYQIPTYREIEHKWWNAICTKFKITLAMDPSVKHADNRLLMTEKRDLLIQTPYAWGVNELDFPPITEVIEPWSPKQAENQFLSRFYELSRLNGLNLCQNYSTV